MSGNLSSPGPRYRALLEVLRTADTLWNVSRVFFSRWDLSPSQFNVLNLLDDAPAGRTQTELSRELLMHRSNLTGLVDRLEARGLVRRLAQPHDRRAHRVTLAPTGRHLLDRILPHYHAAAERVWNRFPVAQLPPVLAALRQLRETAERIAPSDLTPVRKPKPDAG